MAGSTEPELEHARLLQERELRERELALKESELEFQRQEKLHERQLKEQELSFQREQSWWTRWSTPAVVAIVAGLLGYVGTLISSCQGRQLERDKQEGTLILEAIKTAGSLEERERLTAANLVFLADAGLIKSIRPEELAKLRQKAGSAVPSLPAAQGVAFRRSAVLTAALETELQDALADYQKYLGRIGYEATRPDDEVTVQVDEEARNNAYFNFETQSVVLGPNLASDPEYLLSEYTWYALKQSNPEAFGVLMTSESLHLQAFGQGLKFYITCSYLDDPRVGRSFFERIEVAAEDAPGSRDYLFNLRQLKTLDDVRDRQEPHAIGEIWGGGFWELRQKLGREKADRLVLTAWKQFDASSPHLNEPEHYVAGIVASAASLGGIDPDVVRQAFARRKLR